MPARGVRLILLCEDDKHRRFAHHAFRQLGRRYRMLRMLVCPAGRGAAESWVRKHYAEEVAIHRRKVTSQEGLALVVLIDADTQTVEYRHEQLSKVLDESSLAQRRSDEPIVIWVPKRHIETWVADLLGNSVNEQDDYKNAVRDADYRPAAARFIERYQNPARRPKNMLPSMARAFDETDRLHGQPGRG